ncbi:MAG: hypothetical protein AABX86_02885, partial [Nanoarchaeota archaeon]
MGLEEYLAQHQVAQKNEITLDPTLNSIMSAASKILNCHSYDLKHYKVFQDVPIYGIRNNLVFFSPNDIVVVKMDTEIAPTDKRARIIEDRLKSQLKGVYDYLRKQFRCAPRMIGVYWGKSSGLQYFEIPRPLDHLLPSPHATKV